MRTAAFAFLAGVAPFVHGQPARLGADVFPSQARGVIVGVAASAWRPNLTPGSTFAGRRVIDANPTLRSLLLDAQTVEASVIARRSGVRYAVPNQTTMASYTPNDPSLGSQWGLARADFLGMWDKVKATGNSPIAILDTGIQTDHPDLAGHIVAGGYDFHNGDNDPMDDNGHGTHCAGIAAAVTDNAVGIAGASFGATLIAVKVLGANGSGTTWNAAQGITHVVNDTSARVISMSLGASGNDPNLEAACNLAGNAGIVVVAAAGNNGNTTVQYPAGYPTCLAVAASDATDGRPAFSNYGPWVHVAAPGTSIYSTYLPDTYATLQGTSMATPFVSGLVSAMYETQGAGRNPVKASWAKNFVLAGTTETGTWTRFGRINARDSSIFASNAAVSYWNFIGVGPGVTDPDGVRTVMDAAGNLIVATRVGADASTDVLLRKYDKNGVPVWSKTIDGAGMADVPLGLATDTGNNVFFTASSQGPGTGSDLLTCKVSAAGALLWSNRWKGPGTVDDFGRAVVVSGSIVVVAGQSSAGPLAQPDCYLWRFNAATGATIGAKAFNGTANGADTGKAVSLRTDGRVYVVADVAGTGTGKDAVVLLYTPGSNVLTQLVRFNSSGVNDDWVDAVKTTPNGDCVAIGRRPGGSFVFRAKAGGGLAWYWFQNGTLKSLALDAAGSVYTDGFESGAGIGTMFRVVKRDLSNGAILWRRRIAGFGDVVQSQYVNEGLAIDVTGQSVAVSGKTYGATNSDCATAWYDASTGQLTKFARYDAGSANDLGVAVKVSHVTGKTLTVCLTAQAAGKQVRILRY
ncbi:MAG: S8 family serine peptidase [Armatimonadetes bacterium]|nr:S8 family serine peptidase [Armatimonadota bacterium]